MKKILAGACLVCAASLIKADIIADWTFEVNTPADLSNNQDITGIAADVGSGTASGHHASVASDWTTPLGNGSANSLSVNNWGVGDYFQFRITTAGYNSITLRWDQTSSSTGPGNFNLQYSLDGTTFTTFATRAVLENGGSPNSDWSGTTASSAYNLSADLSSVTAINNQSSVYFRLTDANTTTPSGGTVAGTGTDRVDNFTITAVPEPVTWASIVFGTVFGAVQLVQLYRRRVAAAVC